MARATVTKTVRLPDYMQEVLAAAAKVTATSENEVMVTALEVYVTRPSLNEKIRAEVERNRS